MKSITVPSKFIVFAVGLFFYLAAGWELHASAFDKDAEVRARTEAPLYFGTQEVRNAKVGETFIVLQYNASTKRVYVLGQDEAGKPIALNIAEDALEPAPFDMARLLTSVEESNSKGDLEPALKAVLRAVAGMPQDANLSQLRDALKRINEAKDKVALAKTNAASADKKIQQLNHNAQMAARSNSLRPTDNSAEVRADLQQAKDLSDATKKASADADAELAAANESLTKVISQCRSSSNQSVPPALATQQASVGQASQPATTPNTAMVPPSASVVKVATFADACKQYSLDREAANANKPAQLEIGKLYTHYGKLLQITDTSLLVNKFGVKDDGEGWAVMVFEDPTKVGSVSISAGGWVESIIRFTGFKDLEMVDGSQKRIAVFACLGFAPYGGKYIDTSKSQ